MGYHIINIKNGQMSHQYVEYECELMNVEVRKDTIIYQGERDWVPVQAEQSATYAPYCNDWFRAGLKAQELFKKQAKEHRFILEELHQDSKSFSQYLIGDEYLPIKRGDFLLRNFENLEIDVKCRSFEAGKFKFKCGDLECHLNMQKLTGSPVILAVYQRDGANVKENEPYFISINEMNENKNRFKKEYIEKDNLGDCYFIPIGIAHQGFDYLKNFKAKAYSIAEKRKKNPNAYKIWTEQEDNQLELLYCEKKTIGEICIVLGRDKGGIRSRIEKLQLKIKYDV